MAILIDIADSVVAQLNGATLSQPVVAARYYQPRFGVEEMDALHVSVVPRSITNKTLDRTHDLFDYKIDMAIQKRCDGSLTSIDVLMDLVEEICDLFRSQRLLSFPGARCVEVQNDPVYAPEHLEELRQFTSLITLTFKVRS
jgi:hypothetical protein